MPDQLDHIIVGAPDLERAKAWFEKLTGVMPKDGGSHPGLATRNALVSFGGGCYLEIVAPDPSSEVKGSFAEPLTLLDEPTIYHWVVRVDAVEHARNRLRAQGASVGDIRTISRRTTAGDLLSWRMFSIVNHDHRGLLPLYIDWQDCPHPSASAPLVGKLLNFEVSLADEHAEVQRFLDPATRHVSLRRGSTGASVKFESPSGMVELGASGELRGFRV